VRHRRALRAFPVFAAAAAGALAGHWLSYALVFSDAGRRDAALAASGHGYLPAAGRLAIVIVLAAIGAVMVRALDVSGRAQPARREVRRAGIAGLAVRLWMLQSAIFAAMEIAERLASGAPVEGMFRADLFPVGLGAQLVVAVAGALLLAVVHRAAVGVARRGRSRIRLHRPRRRIGLPRPAWPLVGAMPAGAAAPRAPPSA
jgi:hypothetical protein